MLRAHVMKQRYLHMADITFLLTMQLLTSNLVINAISQMTQMRVTCFLDLAICSVTNTMYLLVIWVLIMTAHQFMVAQLNLELNSNFDISV